MHVNKSLHSGHYAQSLQVVLPFVSPSLMIVARVQMLTLTLAMCLLSVDFGGGDVLSTRPTIHLHTMGGRSYSKERPFGRPASGEGRGVGGGGRGRGVNVEMCK